MPSAAQGRSESILGSLRATGRCIVAQVADPWFPHRSDRISATLVNRRVRLAHQRTMLPLYSNSEAGVVLNPAHVQVLCAYPSQGWLKGIYPLGGQRPSAHSHSHSIDL